LCIVEIRKIREEIGIIKKKNNEEGGGGRGAWIGSV